jgi:hypothetical protein
MTKKSQPASKKATKIGKILAYEYPTQTTPATNQVVRRPVTDLDIELVSNFYRNLQNRLRVLAIISLAFFVTNTFLLADILMDWVVSLLLYLAMLIIGALAIGMSINLLMVRKRISGILKEGTVIEVRGPAYRNQLSPKAAAWTVGPISIMPNPGTVLNMMQEGSQVGILCIPSMRIALSINNVGLKYGARITCPPNLEAMAVSEQTLSQKVHSKEEINEVEEIIDKSMNSDERLTKLKELKDKGLITEKDYENKKKEILIDI